jgi:hypothetical protein
MSDMRRLALFTQDLCWTTPPELEVTPTVQWQLDLFNSLYFIGLIFLTIVILPPIFSRNVLRSPLWFAFMGSWMLYCFSFLLLVGQQLGPEPPFGICLFQAALVHAVPALYGILGPRFYQANSWGQCYYCWSLLRSRCQCDLLSSIVDFLAWF